MRQRRVRKENDNCSSDIMTPPALRRLTAGRRTTDDGRNSTDIENEESIQAGLERGFLHLRSFPEVNDFYHAEDLRYTID